MTKLPVRMCIACREQKPKNEMLRIVKSQDGSITLDLKGKKSGRGAYICDSVECIDKCCSKKMLNKAFEMTIEDSIYTQIKEQYEHKN